MRYETAIRPTNIRLSLNQLTYLFTCQPTYNVDWLLYEIWANELDYKAVAEIAALPAAAVTTRCLLHNISVGRDVISQLSIGAAAIWRTRIRVERIVD